MKFKSAIIKNRVVPIRIFEGGYLIMMNYIWVAFVVIAVIAGGVTGNIEAVLNNVFDFAQTKA